MVQSGASFSTLKMSDGFYPVLSSTTPSEILLLSGTNVLDFRWWKFPPDPQTDFHERTIFTGYVTDSQNTARNTFGLALSLTNYWRLAIVVLGLSVGFTTITGTMIW